MSDMHAEIGALVDAAMSTGRRTDAGRSDGLEELARTEVRRYLDRASLGWSTRQALLQVAESEIAMRRRG
ncbi:MAG: hypothetical protein AAGF71_08430 [Pseudomonadota bacterium]